jgi:hypothetical protein
MVDNWNLTKIHNRNQLREMLELMNWFILEQAELVMNMHNILQYGIYKAQLAAVVVENSNTYPCSNKLLCPDTNM